MLRNFLVFKQIDIGRVLQERKTVQTINELGLTQSAKCTGEDDRGKLEITDGELVYLEEGYTTV